MVDSGVANAENRLEVGSKPHLASDSCVAGLFKISSSRLRLDCAFSSTCALLSNAI
jgi:hypothetical protein